MSAVTKSAEGTEEKVRDSECGLYLVDVETIPFQFPEKNFVTMLLLNFNYLNTFSKLIIALAKFIEVHYLQRRQKGNN